jgi:hypothetical protein
MMQVYKTDGTTLELPEVNASIPFSERVQKEAILAAVNRPGLCMERWACKTAGCISGNLCINAGIDVHGLSEEWRSPRSFFEVGRRLGGLTNDEAQRLFFAPNWPPYYELALYPSEAVYANTDEDPEPGSQPYQDAVRARVEYFFKTEGRE